MKKVLMIAPFVTLPWEKGNNRFKYLSELLGNRGFEVRLVTSAFDHMTKQHRETPDRERLSRIPYRIDFVEEPGYERNVSLARLASHRTFAANLKAHLARMADPVDVVYCAIPTPKAALIAGEFARKRGVPFVLDVQDLWPEAMKVVLDVPLISDLAFARMKKQSERAYAMADALVAVSDTYLSRALQANRRSRRNLSVYLGTDIDHFDRLVRLNRGKVAKEEGRFVVTYLGTLGHSYDIATLMAAVRTLQRRGVDNVQLRLVGDGPLRREFQEKARRLEIDAHFTGYVDYGMVAAYLTASDVAVNAIRRKAAQSIVNKIGDYAAAGLPILNGSANPEFRGMVDDERIGINYDAENADSLADALERLYADGEMRREMGGNARKLAERRFDRNRSYAEIADLLAALE